MKRSTFVYFLIRVLVNGMAIAFTAWLMPGITVAANRIVVFVALGVLFGLINTFIRPLVFAVTGRFVIATVGIGVVIINALMLIFLGWFSFGLITIDSLIAALIGAVIMGIVTTSLEVLLGLSQPVSPDDLYQEPDWWGLDRISHGRRNRIIENIRMQQVYGTIWRYGLDIAFSQTIVGDFRSSMQHLMFPDRAQLGIESTPAKVRMMLQELGPTYVKVGQMVSSRSEALPDEWRTELDKLQSNVPPFPSEKAVEMVEAELGAPIDELFGTFELEPLAAASTAQVHRATLLSGEEVVVKVQRPDIDLKVKADLGIMSELASTAEKRTSWASDYDLVSIVGEFADNVIDELDYRNEVYNARRLSANMADLPTIHIPTVYPALSTSSVLTMEFISGVKVTETDKIDGAGLDRPGLARDYIAAAIKQLLFDGFFHGDPHPGNVLVDLGKGQVVFIDLGMVGQLTRDQRMNLADLILALREGDPKELGRVLMALSVHFKPVDESAFLRDLERLYYRYTMFSDDGAGEGFSSVISGALGLMYEHGLRLDPQLTLAIKALTQSEQNSRTLDPDMRIVDTSFDASKELVVQQLDTDVIADLVRRELMRAGKDLVRRLPSLSEATLSWLDQYESGRLTLYVDTKQLSGNLTSFGWSVKQLAIAVLLVGMIIGTALAADTELMSQWRFASSIVSLLFLFAMLMGFLWVIGMVREYWRRDS